MLPVQPLLAISPQSSLRSRTPAMSAGAELRAESVEGSPIASPSMAGFGPPDSPKLAFNCPRFFARKEEKKVIL